MVIRNNLSTRDILAFPRAFPHAIRFQFAGLMTSLLAASRPKARVFRVWRDLERVDMA